MFKRKSKQFGALLRIRRRQEDIRARDLATARRNISLAQDEQARILDEQRRMLDNVSEASQNKINSHNVLRFRQHERHLARLAVEKDASIRELKDTAEEKRRDLEGAMKKRRMVEKLVDRRHRAHHAALRKMEQKATDEVATNKSANSDGRGRSGR